MSDPRTMSRVTDPTTSHEAAAGHIASGANAAHQALILAAVERLPGSTSDEIAVAAGIDRHAAARRMAELERAGKVRRGEPRVSNVSGRRGVTWFRAVEPGRLF